MKALNYLKNKGRFLMAFVICCFAIQGCEQPKPDICMKYCGSKHPHGILMTKEISRLYNNCLTECYGNKINKKAK